MKTIEVTELEKQVLEALAGEMYAEPGFSDAGLPEVLGITKLTSQVVRGVASSLIQKGLLDIDRRDNEWDVNANEPMEQIWFLDGDAWGLVPHWVEEDPNLYEEAKLVVK